MSPNRAIMTSVKNFTSFLTVNTSPDHPIGAYFEEIRFVREIMVKFSEELASLGGFAGEVDWMEMFFFTLSEHSSYSTVACVAQKFKRLRP
ncbi:hypothetical protein Tco_0355089 [Tanacetum coccineum]